jgi:hypothetical protein
VDVPTGYKYPRSYVGCQPTSTVTQPDTEWS